MVWEVETVGDGLNGDIGLVSEYVLGTQHNKMLYPVTSSMPCLQLNDLAEIFWREVKELGVKLYVALLMTVFKNGIVKPIA